jgi:hypothetical protein
MKITKLQLEQIIREEIEEMVLGNKIGFSFKQPRPLTDSAIFKKDEEEEELSEGIYGGKAMPQEIDYLNDALYLLGNIEKTLAGEEGRAAMRALKDAGSAADLLQKALGHKEQGETQFMSMRRAALQKAGKLE